MILDPLTKLDAKLETSASRILGFALAIASEVNQMAGDTLALQNDSLTEWLAKKGTAAGQLFADQYTVGSAVHALLEPIQRQLGQKITEPCDLRSVAEKLAAQNRAIVDGVVIDFPIPEPQPAEPEKP